MIPSQKLFTRCRSLFFHRLHALTFLFGLGLGFICFSTNLAAQPVSKRNWSASQQEAAPVSDEKPKVISLFFPTKSCHPSFISERLRFASLGTSLTDADVVGAVRDSLGTSGTLFQVVRLTGQGRFSGKYFQSRFIKPKDMTPFLYCEQLSIEVNKGVIPFNTLDVARENQLAAGLQQPSGWNAAQNTAALPSNNGNPGSPPPNGMVPTTGFPPTNTSTRKKPNVFFECAAANPGASTTLNPCTSLERLTNLFKQSYNNVNYATANSTAQLVIRTLIEEQASETRFQMSLLGRDELRGKDSTLVFRQLKGEPIEALQMNLFATLMPSLEYYIQLMPFETASNVAPRDKWNNWSFSENVDGNVNISSFFKFATFSNSLKGSRATEKWFTEFNIRGQYQFTSSSLPLRTFVPGSNPPRDTTIVQTSSTEYTAYDVNLIAARTLSARWHPGIIVRSFSNPSLNQKSNTLFLAGFEMNVFPNDAGGQTDLRIRYLVGPIYSEYLKETVVCVGAGDAKKCRTEELLLHNMFALSMVLNKPWGSIFGSIQGTQFFDSVYPEFRIQAFGNASLRLTPKVSMNLSANISRSNSVFRFQPGSGTDLSSLLSNQDPVRFGVNFGIIYAFGASAFSFNNRRFLNAVQSSF